MNNILIQILRFAYFPVQITRGKIRDCCISSTHVARTNQYTSKPSLWHFNPGSSMITAPIRRSEGCGFDSRLGLTETFFWVCDKAWVAKQFTNHMCYVHFLRKSTLKLWKKKIWNLMFHFSCSVGEVITFRLWCLTLLSSLLIVTNELDFLQVTHIVFLFIMRGEIFGIPFCDIWPRSRNHKCQNILRLILFYF